MKKLVLPLVLASLALAPAALGQEKKSAKQERNEKSYQLLVDQYATSTLGYYIEQRCRQLDETAYTAFSDNQKLLDGFMLILMGAEDNVKLVDGVKATASDAEMNPCNLDTFKFSLATMQIASNLSTRVQLLGEDELIKLNQALKKQMNAAQASQTQTTTPAQTTTTQPTTVEEPQVQETEVEAEPVDTTPKTTFETLSQTPINRQPEPEKKTVDTPTTTTTTGGATQTTQTAAVSTQTGIVLANYVNPYPYTAPPPPPGETEKDMKRRQRQEIIDIRSAHRAELDAFRDNQDSYADPDAVKDAIQDRQEAEFDALRNRQYEESKRY